MKKIKILFVNGSRSEWGYIEPIIDKCIKKKIEFRVFATNMTILNKHGNIVEELEKYKKFRNCFYKSYMSMEGSSHNSMAKSLGICILSISDVIQNYNPDWVVLAGDRGEQLAAAIAASYSYKAIAHIQAGERSGNIDGIARHSITKLSHLHFASNLDAYERVKKLGEQRFRIFNFGAPQLDYIKKNLVKKKELQQKLKLEFNKDFSLVVFHPITEEYKNVNEYTNNLLNVLSKYKINHIFIFPNNDAGAKVIINKLELLKKKNMQNIQLHRSLGRYLYHGVLALAKNKNTIVACVGNSSSGVKETPAFGCPTVNIGSRQQGRLRGGNVIDANYSADEIIDAVKKCINDASFRASCRITNNPYYLGGAGKKIAKILAATSIDQKLLRKRMTLIGEAQDGWFR